MELLLVIALFLWILTLFCHNLKLLWNVFLVFATGGLWLIVLLVGYLIRNK